MDLQVLQYQMWLAIKKHQHLVAKGKEDPENPTLQKEILDVLCHLINLNDQQKLIISQMRERKKTTDVNKKYKQNEVNLFCEEQLVQEPNLSDDEDDRTQEEPVDYSRKGKNHVSTSSVVRADNENGHLVERRMERKYVECNGTNPSSPASLVSPSKPHDYANGYHGPVPRGESKDLPVHTRKDRPGDASNGFFTSSEKKTKLLQQEPEDSWSEDVHDLVTQEEFMHALSLLTLKECEEVVVKRTERRKRNAFSTVFSSTIWEKPETKRKRRAWLMSGAGSPPNLRRKNRATTNAALASSQPPSCPSSRPPSRAPSPTPSASSSTPLYQSPHHSNATSLPASPDSSTKSRSQSPVSEEICPMCNVKGADLQCDGCGIVYHSQCVDALDIDNPDQWLCLKCEQLGLRSRSLLDPSQQIQRREALCERERLLRQRAELTVAKAELEQRKRDMSMALQVSGQGTETTKARTLQKRK
ncbi:uncharacterized protein LOC143036376 isoform X2 [Oratosquilla oratoria]|uniref:uncharacterized protein LOC143036376 isoform X2 n=1 Tax=Oratosquilla oratoria TaxID=337810 RepID=UPI003F75B967